MTQIEYSMKDLYLRADGHSRHGPVGGDIVCAGVSVLTHALLNTLMEEEEKKEMQLDWTMMPGHIEIRAKPANKGSRRRARDYFTVTVTGLKAMAQDYELNVEIKEVQDSGNV